MVKSIFLLESRTLHTPVNYTESASKKCINLSHLYISVTINFVAQ